MKKTRTFLFLLFNCFNLFIFSLEVTSLSHEDSFKIGEKKNFEISVTNDQDEPVEISLSLYDYEPLENGQGNFKEVGTVKNSNANWITLPYQRILLKPKEHKKITCEISVPKDASLKGSYWSRIMIEPEDVKMPTTEKEGVTILSKIRYAFGVISHVGSPVAKMKILEKGIVKIDNKEYMFIELKNLGAYLLRPDIKLKLFGEDGKLDATLKGSSISFYPGLSNRYLIPIKDLKKKKYKVFFSLERKNAEPIADVFEFAIK